MKISTNRFAYILFKGLYSLYLLVAISLSGFSQGVVINTTGNPPNASAGLDVDFPDKGLLIPRVALTATNNASPLAAHISGMMVYNTATTGDVTPGFYYDNGTKWIPSIPAGNSAGDMLFWNGSAWILIPAGVIGQLLQSNGTGMPSWVTGGSSPFPMATLTTTAASAITGISATSGGNITSDGGLAVLSRGVCWSTIPFPTIADAKTTDGSGTGVFTSSLTGLIPATVYYVRAYAFSSAVVSYGNQVSFTTSAVLPTLAATTIVTNITGTTATSGGNVTNDGGAAITERGICYGTSSLPTTANTKVIDPSPGVGVFVSNMTGLLSTTLYYVRSYAINSVGTAYGIQTSFFTYPSLTTTPATAITGGSATTGGVLTAAGGTGNVWYYGIAYSTTPNAVSPIFVQTGTFPPTSPLTFVTILTGLTGNTLYYIRAWAGGSGYTTFGPELSFTTLAATAPIVASTAAITGKTANTAISGGTITNDGGSPITLKGVCWGTSANPVKGAGNFTSDGTGMASFVSNITGLTGSTTYHVRAYATNSVGTSYGPADVIFTTWVQAPYIVGQAVGGYGTCAYVDSTGSGFIISPDIYPTSPATSFTWGCDGTHVPVGTAMGTGLANTNLIIANCGSNNAAGTAKAFAGGGYVDWYLPSYDEWNAISWVYYYFGLTVNTSYFTSSEYGTNYSLAGSYFATGAQAYASGSPRAGDVYTTAIRAIRSFTNVEVTTNPITNIAGTTATSGGFVISNGGPPVTARGVCWSTSSAPTITDSHTTNGSGTGAFTSNMTGLTRGTTYHVRAYATSSSTVYGNDVVFTTIARPTLTTTPVSTVSSTAVNTGGTIITDGGAPITVCGVCWNTAPNPTIALTTKTNDILLLVGGSYPSSITGLSPGTYYIRAYASNIAGTSYGNQISIVAGSVVPPTVTTNPIINKIGAMAEGGGIVQSDGGDVLGISASGICWSTTTNPTIADAHTVDMTSWFPYPYFSTLTGLSVGTLYHVRAYATNSAGTGYGANVNFTETAATIGQVITGGWLPYGNVFYIDGTGLHGLTGLTFSNSPADWGCTNSTTGASGTAVFTGFTNTAAIISNITLNSCVSADPYAQFAAPLCQVAGANVYLPSKDEMNWLWTNRVASGLDPYVSPAGATYPFWSSSEVNATHAWYFDTTIPTPAWINTGLKTDQYNAWPIWAF